MTPSTDVRVTRALVSVSDKSGLADLAQRLAALGVEIVSTGGTARAVQDAGVDVIPIDDVTGFPEMMDGRVKTLHPNVHGALLARRDLVAHMSAASEHGITPIDLVIVNLYPFEQTVAKDGVTDEDAIENIDIGGPSMIRSAAKNHASVAVVTDPSQYGELLDELEANNGSTTLGLRTRLAAAAFTRTAAYDSAISAWMTRDEPGFPETLALAYTKRDTLRYGENPHQDAAVYASVTPSSGTLLDATQLHGKELSYNNINDASAALELVRAMGATCSDKESNACVVKHTNPCGAARATSAAGAIDAAIAGDPLAAFGGILACSSTIDLASAQRIAADGTFFEIVIAPSYDDDALELLKDRWKNLRILQVGTPTNAPTRESTRETRWIPGGLLVQDRNLHVPDPSAWTHAAGPAPTGDTLRAAAMLEHVIAALGSNAVLIGGTDDGRTRLFGAGAGQMDRVAACRAAVHKSGDLAKGAIALSDAFFPFPDGPEILIGSGVSTIVHPGGSKRDSETFDLCDERGVTCLTTGTRHFRH